MDEDQYDGLTVCGNCHEDGEWIHGSTTHCEFCDTRVWE
jgi:hypothetical protein